jgi:two-component system C4-dicarboxylate transport response regulator DctD
MSRLVLLVDDDADASFRLALAFMSVGYQVRIAVNREDALDYIDYGGMVTLAVVDLQLPGTSGVLLAKELRGRTPEIPVLEVSGAADKQFLCEELEAGRTQFLEKMIVGYRKYIKDA